MSEYRDLTRWNRAGKTRFRYVDGNAVEYLERLRQNLVAQFGDPDTGLCDWINPPEPVPQNEIEADGESLIERQQRLALRQKRMLETYRQDRRDWAWEISRSFARCCHILTEYADAYANEGFLGTATQWEHVRRLVEMLDYHPAPPASASAWLGFAAKDGKSGVVPKGFQIKNSPADGGDKVLFETLDALNLDYQLNALRPSDWDQNSDPAVSDGGGDDLAERQFSPVANEAVIYVQGVGDVWSAALNNLPDYDDFKIKDFLDIDPDNAPGLDVSTVRLRELKAKATVISYFELESGWADIIEWLLLDITAASAPSLSEITGKNLEQVKQLQLTIELIAAYLDQPFFNKTKLKDLLAPAAAIAIDGSLSTGFIAPNKPKIDAGQVAMIFHKSNGLAEAATIAEVDQTSGFIDLLPSPVQYSWANWPLAEISLYVSPRWQKDCWLNGDNVIRTTEPHGLAAEAQIAWKRDNLWFFAEVIEVDKRGLRIDFDGSLPVTGTPLYEAYPLESDVMATTLEAIGLAGGGQPNVEDFSFPDAEAPIFTMKEPPVDASELPPLMPPGGLSFGSFLFPTPMLPMDLVKAAVDLMLSIGVMVIPSTGEVVFKSLPEPPTAQALFDELDGKVNWRADLPNAAARKAALAEMLQASVDEPIVLFQQILDNLEEKGPLIAVRKNPPVKAIVDLVYPLYMFDSNPEKVIAGDWVVGRFSDGLRALEVRAINEYSDSDKSESFSLSFTNLVGSEGELQTAYADFRAQLAPENASFNTTLIEGDELELENVPDSLQLGQDVLLTADGKDAVAAKIERIDGNTVVTKPPASGFTKGELIINGNVVLAGHGESKPEKILGSGDAAKSNQAFVLDVQELSFIADATMSSGVAAAIDVRVDGRVWEQVSSLKDSLADDHHYVGRMTEEGTVKIHFGDGKYGRRLPTGKNNVRVRYRVGSGISGNVAARSLEKAVNPHPLVESIVQWQSASGGGDMEDTSSLRDNAPPTLLALQRAVSLADFSHLASAQSSIWQAKAYNEVLHGGRSEKVRVVIVAAGGVSSNDIKKELKNYLQQQALPGVLVCVDDFVPALFDLTVTIRVDSSAYNPAQVQSAVSSALTDHFALKNRALGAHLYLSEAYKVVEAVEGVENSICLLNDDERLKVITATDQSMVIYLDSAAGSTLSIAAEEYQP